LSLLRNSDDTTDVFPSAEKTLPPSPADRKFLKMKGLLLLLAVFRLSFAGAAEGERDFLNNGVTAHRGGGGEVPENTLPAFRHAIACGVDWAELDIFLTRDRQVVVIHDATTKRVGDRDLKVGDSTYEELRSVDVATQFRREHALTVETCPPASIPLLSEVLALFLSQQRTRVSIQPKDESTAAALALVQKLKAEPWVGFNDGDLQKMIFVKRASPEMPVFWDRGAKTNLEDDLRIAQEHGFETLVIERKGISAERIRLVHDAGLKVGAWTVNDRKEMQQFLRWGIDRLYTDVPSTMLRRTNKSER
jgi:glycerophosphoryl diester phosphodiesterase